MAIIAAVKQGSGQRFWWTGGGCSRLLPVKRQSRKRNLYSPGRERARSASRNGLVVHLLAIGFHVSGAAAERGSRPRIEFRRLTMSNSRSYQSLRHFSGLLLFPAVIRAQLQSCTSGLGRLWRVSSLQHVEARHEGRLPELCCADSRLIAVQTPSIYCGLRSTAPRVTSHFCCATACRAPRRSSRNFSALCC